MSNKQRIAATVKPADVVQPETTQPTTDAQNENGVPANVTIAPNNEQKVQTQEQPQTDTPSESDVKTEPPVVQETNAQKMKEDYLNETAGGVDLEKIEKSMPTPTTKHLVVSLGNYISEMHPRKHVTPDDCAKQMVKMKNMLDVIFNKISDDEFAAFYPKFLAIVNSQSDNVEPSGAFGMRYVFRGIEHAVLSKEDLEGFQRLMNMVLSTCEPSSRKLAVKSLDWERALTYCVTADARVRLLSFYGV